MIYMQHLYLVSNEKYLKWGIMYDKEVVDYRSVEKADQGQIFIDTPSKSGPQLCMYRAITTEEKPVRGDCIRLCPLLKEKQSTEQLRRNKPIYTVLSRFFTLLNCNIIELSNGFKKEFDPLLK